MEPSPLERPARDLRVEEYLAQVLEQMPRTMSPACRLECHAELTAHLEALIAAHIELGSDEETAVGGALQRFGSATDLGRQLSRQWKLSAYKRKSAHELVPAAVVFFGCLCFGGSLVCMLFPGWPTAPLAPRPLGPCLDLLVPCLVGYFWGRQLSDGTRSRRLVVLSTVSSR
jgi:hypothetical protein